MKNGKGKVLWKQVYRYRMLYLMLLPGAVTVLIFYYMPLYGVQIAFKDYRTSLGIMGSEWIGLENFIQFFQCQTITYAPHFISTVLVCSMTILFLNREGLFNIIGQFFIGGSYQSTDFMSNPGVFPWAYVLSGLWSEFGWGTIIYIATLSAVSMELVEYGTFICRI